MFDEHTERVLEHVRSRKGEWDVEADGALRRRIQMKGAPTGFVVWCCPISSMWDEGAENWTTVATAEEIPDKSAWEIVYSADADEDCNPALRAALLEAAGLSDKGETHG